jgi:hypothetical protein
MGHRPDAHLWLGTKAVTETPFNGRYDEETEEDIEGLDWYDWDKKLTEELNIRVVHIDGCGDDDRYALALQYHRTDWDDDLELDLKAAGVNDGEWERLKKACQLLGWEPELNIKWRLAATYPT